MVRAFCCRERSRLKDHTRHVLVGLDAFTILPATAQFCFRFFQVGVPLGLVVECRNDYVSPFVPVRVVPVVAYDESTDAVIVGVHLRHDTSLAGLSWLT